MSGTARGGTDASVGGRPHRIAVYPGSFDPIHNGHLDLIERCRHLFDEVIVAVLRNEEKKPLFTSTERAEMIRELVEPYGNCRVERFSGLLVEFVDQMGACAVVRGLRAVSDFEYEFQMALMNRRLNPRVATLFMMPREDFSFLSSRTVKEVFSLGANLEGLVPPSVISCLRQRFDEIQGNSPPADAQAAVPAASEDTTH